MQTLNIVPVEGRGYWYCCVFPVTPVHAWTASLQQRSGSAALLEYDLEGPFAENAEWRPVPEQTWPKETIRNTQIAQAKGLRLSAGIPFASAAALIPPVMHEIHYVTLGFQSQGIPMSMEEWSAVRDAIVTSLLPSHWPGDERCEAILHVNEANFAFLLTPIKDLAVDWIGDLVSQQHRVLSGPQPHAYAARRELGRWILEEAEGSGVRIHDAALSQASDAPTLLVLHGSWGRDPDVPLTVGDSGGETFHERLPLTYF